MLSRVLPVAVLLLALACATGASVDQPTALAAFREVASVLRSPRCMNCHTRADGPLITDALVPHAMNVRRGPDGKGLPGQRCVTCHTEHNQQETGVPGAHAWAMAPLSMVWEGLDDHDLASALRDPAKNGNRTLEHVALHSEHDPLVLWAWAPGETRTTPPITHAQFLAAMRTWVAGGGPIPAKGATR